MIVEYINVKTIQAMGDTYTSGNRITADNRTYFLDICQNHEGEVYVNVTENKQLPDGNWVQQKVLFFEKDLFKIMETLKVAIQLFPVSKNSQNNGSSRLNPDFI